MNPTFRRTALAIAVLGLGISVGVAACGGGSSSTTTAAETTTSNATTTTATTTDGTTTAPPGPTTIRIAVRGAQPVGGIQRPSVAEGERVVLVVTSDVADEIHLHGYDLSADAAPGSPARIAFTADVAGRFEVELENHGVQIAELTVEP